MMPRVQLIERTFLILREVGTNELGVTELALRVQLPRSTVSRILAALEQECVIEQVAGGRYRLGAGLEEILGYGTRYRSLVTAARPILEQLRGLVNESVGLSVLDGLRVLYLDHAECQRQVRLKDWTGARVAPNAVPSGVVMMASLPEPVLNDYLAEPVVKLTAHTVVAPDALRERLNRARDTGIAWGYREFDLEVNSVAVALNHPDGSSVALHVHGPAFRFPKTGDQQFVEDQLRAAASELSKVLRGPVAQRAAS